MRRFGKAIYSQFHWLLRVWLPAPRAIRKQLFFFGYKHGRFTLAEVDRMNQWANEHFPGFEVRS